MQHSHLVMTMIAMFFLIRLYYLHIKKYIFASAPHWAIACGLTRRYPLTIAAGVLQLITIVLTHLLFCVAICGALNRHPQTSLALPLVATMWCVIIGIGCVMIATLLCQLGMLLASTFFSTSVPETEEGWWCIARAGWMRHHQHSLMILPSSIALTIVLLQLAAEEIIFRVVLLNLLHDAGAMLAIIVSTMFFMYMQTFHMPSRMSAMFPVIGAMVLGWVNAVIYTQVCSITALLIIHMTYFIVAVLL